MNKFFLIVIAFLIVISCEKIDGSRVNKITITNQYNQGSNATLSGRIIDIKTNQADSYGHFWSKTPSFDLINKTEFFNASRGDIFQSTLRNIEYNTNYFCKSYMVSDGDTIFSVPSSLLINDASNIIIAIDSIVFTDPYNLNTYVTLDGLNSLIAQDHGICWSKNPVITPSISIQSQIHSNGYLNTNTNYVSEINNLTQNSVYSIVPYVKLSNSLVIYGDQYFANISTFQIYTSNHFINNNGAILTGGFTNIGGYPITDHGHCWSTSNSFPEITTDNTISLGPTNQNGLFDTFLQLNSGNTYYYRAYAVDILGVQYGDVYSFTF